ncbi:S1/P1 nuclease [Gorgonomyces haynaldii]|nr:S1/P1 nuclease [Gorgonomyces haynaldii]
MHFFLSGIVLAFGDDGHQAIGQVANAFLTPTARNQVQAILGNGESLASVATWADRVKASAGNSQLHFVNVNDNPSTDCGYIDDRDCSNGRCIVRAVTTAAAGVKQGDYESLKYLVHFVGDMHQPLHVCGRERGGNDVKVSWGRRTMTFHSIWDTPAVTKRMTDTVGSVSYQNYANYLVNQIRTGGFSRLSQRWLSSNKILSLNQNRNSLAVIDWAVETDGINCDLVWGSYDQDSSQDFSQDYYRSIATSIDLQIAKAGYRLANALNQLLV